MNFEYAGGCDLQLNSSNAFGYELYNDDYILQNGVIVLVDEDIEAYMDGTLVFYTGEVQ